MVQHFQVNITQNILLPQKANKNTRKRFFLFYLLSLFFFNSNKHLNCISRFSSTTRNKVDKKVRSKRRETEPVTFSPKSYSFQSSMRVDADNITLTSTIIHLIIPGSSEINTCRRKPYTYDLRLHLTTLNTSSSFL